MVDASVSCAEDDRRPVEAHAGVEETDERLGRDSGHVDHPVLDRLDRRHQGSDQRQEVLRALDDARAQPAGGLCVAVADELSCLTKGEWTPIPALPRLVINATRETENLAIERVNLVWFDVCQNESIAQLRQRCAWPAGERVHGHARHEAVA